MYVWNGFVSFVCVNVVEFQKGFFSPLAHTYCCTNEAINPFCPNHRDQRVPSNGSGTQQVDGNRAKGRHHRHHQCFPPSATTRAHLRI